MKKKHSRLREADTYVPLKKFFRTMKLTLFVVLLSTIQILANSVYSQSTRFTLSKENVTIENVLNAIEDQSEFYFLYNGKLVDVSQKVNIKVEKENLETTLNELLRNTNIAYKIYDRQVVLSPNQDGQIQQQKSVSGKVIDSDGSPLPGVSVVLKGTTIGTITDADGKYSLSNVPENGTLQFSFVGMKGQEVKVGTQTSINIVLAEETVGIEEVVAVGYGTVKKSDLTGSIASVKNEDFNRGAISSVDQALQGRIAGVQISQTSSEPGGGISIRIRGASSINAGNEPLYVIDGLPIDNSEMLSSSSAGAAVAGVSRNPNSKNPLNSLNPNDIESIEILKDASATAIYGSRGANGVVLVTTKRGSSKALTIIYDFYGGIQTVARKIDILSTEEYIKTLNSISNEMGQGLVFSPEKIAQIGSGTDWQDVVLRTAPVQNHNLSMSGGMDKTKYFASVNYFNQDGIVVNTGIKKYIARINVEQEIKEKIKIGLNINTSLVKDDNYVDGLNNNEAAGPVNAALLYDPTMPIKDLSGEYTISPDLTINNPASVIYGITNKSETNRFFGNLTGEYKLTKDLVAKINIGSDRQTSRRDVFNSRKTINGKPNNGIADIASLERSNVLFEYTMSYSKAFNEKHFLNILGGTTYQDFLTRTFSAGTSGFPSDVLLTNNLGLGNPTLATISSNKSGYTLLSYIGRINYSAFNRFLLTASIRADGSSRFGENNKYGYFPSFAFGWKLSEEEFIPELFNELKFRASWGETGNQEISNYASLSTYGMSGIALLGGKPYVGTQPSRIANPDLKWERTRQLNLGFDYGFLKGRISGTLDYFIKNTSDLLLAMPLPTSSGFPSILSNVGSMKNSGYELMIHSRNISAHKLKWTTTLNFSALKNKVTNIGDLESIVLGDIQAIGNTTIIKPGLPLNSYYGYNIIGIFQDANEVANSAQPGSKPGYPIFEDTNDDKTITPADQKILGDPFPDFTYGLRNVFTLGNLELDFFIQGQEGAEMLNVNAIESMFPINFRRNRISLQMDERWTLDHRDTKWPSGVTPSSYGGSKVNSLVVEDASFIRLKSVQLGYNIPMKNRRLINSARVYLTGQNLFTVTNYTGYDPETNSFGNSNVKADYNAYPLARVYSFGLNITF